MNWNTASVYTCGKCGAAVKMVDGKPVRTCEHTTAAVSVSLSSTCIGKGGFKG